MNNLLFKLLKRATIASVEKQDLHLQLLSHTDYPSLKSITDSLDYFGIENVAANVPKDALAQLPSSFLALIKDGSDNELLLVERGASKIRVTNDSGKKRTYDITTFQKLWTGTIIAIEVPEKSTVTRSFNISKERVFTSVLVLTALGLLIVQGVTFLSGIYTILSLLGLGISYLVIKETMGEGTAIVSKVCGTITTDAKGCSTVINSNKGTIIKGLGLGDISLMYFLSITISSAILGVSTSSLLIIATLSLPVVFYAVYSQAFVLKSWCALCLGIASVLLFQFVVLAISFTGWEFSLQYIVRGLFIATLVSISWLLIKPLLENKKLLSDTQKEYLVLKRDAFVFDAILKENEIVNLETVGEDAQIFFGNREGVVQLTAYTNPFCGFCTEAFEAYDKLLSQFPEDIGVQFIFSVPEDATNPSTVISKRIVEFYQEDTHKAFKALKDWFSSKDIDLWKSSYGESSSMLLSFDNILNEHRRVVKTNGISYTPETLIGASKFSRKYYKYNDIPLFINHLKEQQEEKPVGVSV